MNRSMILNWERLYLEKGSKALYEDHRGKKKLNQKQKGQPPKLDKQVEEDLIAENQRLRMENEFLKKLNALVQEREEREEKK
jgi:transposase